MQRWRHLNWLGAAALSMGACAPAPDTGGAGPQQAGAVTGARASFQRASFKGTLRRPPAAQLASARMITAVVQIEGDPITAVQGVTPDRLSTDDKQRIRAQLKTRQAALRGSIEAMGAHVFGEYQNAYNGLKVRVPQQQLAQLRGLPGVLAVHPIRTYKRANTNGVPLVGAPQVWSGALGVRGEGIRIGILDTGIDYTHADFGGPGTAAAFSAAATTSAAPPDPKLIGPKAPKVKGGTDLVGDAYDAGGTGDALTPHPDDNPLDCAGHGSHVAGTAAGFGVLSDGTRYTGPYDTSTIPGHSFLVGPGVAPLADLYAVRVFVWAGSDGSEVQVDAIEWAVDHDLDVINLSLGSDFGTSDGPEQEAINNAAAAGVITVSSAGNSGGAPYITGGPASAQRAISVAALDPVPSFPGATVALGAGQSFSAINANGAAFASGAALPVKVLRNADGTVSLGCDPAEYAGTAGKLVVTVRGTCARVARAIYGQAAGAAAVAMINTSAALPPFEGAITSNPDTGEPATVTIPFLGVTGVLGPDPTDDGDNLVAADGGTVTLTSIVLPNPTYKTIADFSSGGPRNGDSWLKPDLSGPGVSIRSVSIGTGTDGTVLSGTSMASPHVAGVAALTRQAHLTWSVEDIKLAVVNTADPGQVTGYVTRQAGAGLAQAPGAARTAVVASGDRYTGALNFGFDELTKDLSGHKHVHLVNHGPTDVTFQVAAALPQGAPHSVTLGATQVRVKARKSADLDVRLDVPAASVGDSSDFREVAGIITLTPVGNDNGGVALRVPYYLVPRARSNVRSDLAHALNRNHLTSTADITNKNGAIAGNADFYAWGLEDGNDHLGSQDLRAVGVQSFADPTAADPDDHLLVFAVSTWRSWSNASTNEIDLLLDVNDDGVADYDVVGVDLGLLTTGDFTGSVATAVIDLASGGAVLTFLASAPTDSSTALLPLHTSDLCFPPTPCVTAAGPRFNYQAQATDLLSGDGDSIDGFARFNAWSSAIAQGQFATVPPGTAVSIPVAVDPIEWTLTPAKGLMIVTQDNRNGADQAQLIRVNVR